VSNWKIGAMYKVPWSPNGHRLEKIIQEHCSLHGDITGKLLLHLRKKKNNGNPESWGAIFVTSSDRDGIQLIAD